MSEAAQYQLKVFRDNPGARLRIADADGVDVVEINLTPDLTRDLIRALEETLKPEKDTTA